MDKFLQIATSTAKEVRNIYNQKEITLFIDKIIDSKNIQEINLITWLRSNVRNYILKEQPIKIIESLVEVIEDWAILGVQNKTLSKVLLSEEFNNELSHAIDYLHIEYANKDLSRLNVKDTIIQSIKWIENQEKVDDDIEGRIKVNDSDDGYYIVEILNEQALKYEGGKMNHCIGLYYVNQILNQTKRAFSLRDKNNNPHITILYDKETQTIEEMKGNSNKKVKNEYQKYIVSFLNNFSFNFNTIKDYNFIENISYENNSFIYKEEAIKNRSFHTIFRFNDMRIPNLTEKSITKYKSSFLTSEIIKENLYINDLSKLDPSVINKKFRSIAIDNIFDINCCKTFKKIKSHNLEIKEIKDKIPFIDNDYASILMIKNTSSNKKITNIRSKSVKQLHIESTKLLAISNIDLSLTTDLEIVVINNCIIDNLILPTNTKKLKIINSKINNLNICKINELFVNNSEVNNSTLNCGKIYSYQSKFNDENIIENALILSDKHNNVISSNKIDNDNIQISNREIIKDDLSALYNDTNSIIIPKLFTYPSTELKLHTITGKIIDICNHEYKKDVEFLCNTMNLQISYFNIINKLDVNYVTNKINDNGPKNRIVMKKEFAQYLKSENALMQLFLFENLRMLNPSGVNLEIFSKIIKDEPHIYIKKLINIVQDNHDYLQNDDYNNLLNIKAKKQNGRVYFDNIQYTKSIGCYANEDNIFKSELFKSYWINCKNIKLNKELKDNIFLSKKNTDILLTMNIFKDIDKASNILIDLYENEIDLTLEDKEKIMFNMIENHPIEDKKNELIIHDINNTIINKNLYDILTRTDIINGFVSYQMFLDKSQKPMMK